MKATPGILILLFSFIFCHSSFAQTAPNLRPRPTITHTAHVTNGDDVRAAFAPRKASDVLHLVASPGTIIDKIEPTCSFILEPTTNNQQPTTPSITITGKNYGVLPSGGVIDYAELRNVRIHGQSKVGIQTFLSPGARIRFLRLSDSIIADTGGQGILARHCDLGGDITRTLFYRNGPDRYEMFTRDIYWHEDGGPLHVADSVLALASSGVQPRAGGTFRGVAIIGTWLHVGQVEGRDPRKGGIQFTGEHIAIFQPQRLPWGMEFGNLQSLTLKQIRVAAPGPRSKDQKSLGIQLFGKGSTGAGVGIPPGSVVEDVIVDERYQIPVASRGDVPQSAINAFSTGVRTRDLSNLPGADELTPWLKAAAAGKWGTSGFTAAHLLDPLFGPTSGDGPPATEPPNQGGQEPNPLPEDRPRDAVLRDRIQAIIDELESIHEDL